MERFFFLKHQNARSRYAYSVGDVVSVPEKYIQSYATSIKSHPYEVTGTPNVYETILYYVHEIS